MKTAFCLLGLLGAATAFVPAAPRVSRGRSLRMSVNDLIGADTETGGIWGRLPCPPTP